MVDTIEKETLEVIFHDCRNIRENHDLGHACLAAEHAVVKLHPSSWHTRTHVQVCETDVPLS